MARREITERTTRMAMLAKDDESDKKGEAVAAAVRREFARIVYTGTMGCERQMIRPAHEVAVGLWLARLGGC